MFLFFLFLFYSHHNLQRQHRKNKENHLKIATESKCDAVSGNLWSFEYVRVAGTRQTMYELASLQHSNSTSMSLVALIVRAHHIHTYTHNLLCSGLKEHGTPQNTSSEL